MCSTRHNALSLWSLIITKWVLLTVTEPTTLGDASDQVPGGGWPWGIPLTSQQETWWQLTSHDIGIGLQPRRASSQCSVSWGRSEAAGHCRDWLQLRRLSPVTNQHQSPLQSRSQQQRNVASTDITQKMVTWGHGGVAASLSHHVWGKYSSLHKWVNACICSISDFIDF